MSWAEIDHKLTKDFVFEDFDSAFEFANKIRLIANSLNHHPDLHISWSKLTVFITTHDQGNKVTEKDYSLATEIDKL